MRRTDEEVREVVCSETGKPMTKIPLWMADIRVKFVSDDARQRHLSSPVRADPELARQDVSPGVDVDGLAALGTVGAIEDGEFAEIDAEAEPEEVVDEAFEEEA